MPQKRALISTFFWVVLLLCVTRFVLVQCGVTVVPPAQAPSVPSSSPPEPAPSSSTSAGHAGSNEASIAVHLPLGTPSDADPSDDRLLDEHSFIVSYSPTKRVPNWVAWRLDRSYLGHVRRSNDFRPDPLLPSDLYHVSERDYAHSGYDRGHLCPSADREDSALDNSSTFVFTNIEPQLHELNAGPWEKFEKYERARAEEPGVVLYIVAGGIFSNPSPTVGDGVAVPAANFKIVVVMREGERASDVSAETEVVSVLMPNERGVGAEDYREFSSSVDAIEQASGYDFLSAVPDPIERVIEARSPRF